MKLGGEAGGGTIGPGCINGTRAALFKLSKSLEKLQEGPAKVVCASVFYPESSLQSQTTFRMYVRRSGSPGQRSLAIRFTLISFFIFFYSFALLTENVSCSF